MRFRRPSPALVISLVALFVALGGAGYAATGGNFILGQNNTATSPTLLTANSNGKALQLIQNNTAVGSTALGLNVRAGQAPLVTNSSVKVTNLNADKLDGFDSSSFTRRLFAEVQAAGVVDNSSGGVTAVKLGTGSYEVNFGFDITACAAVATIGPSGGGSALGEVNLADRSGNVNAVFVDTNNSDGTAADKPFRLIVVC